MLDLNNLFLILTPIAGALALIFAVITALSISKKDPGNDRMQKISANIADGAKAFLFSEYKILIIFAIVLFVAITFAINIKTAICFVVGALFSTLAGYFGMTMSFSAEPKMMYCVLPAMVPSFCPQRKGQSSKFSKWSGCRKSSPGATLPGMNEKSARLLP
jgi:Na+/H+-translocating membrane pyrophosphatase